MNRMTEEFGSAFHGFGPCRRTLQETARDSLERLQELDQVAFLGRREIQLQVRVVVLDYRRKICEPSIVVEPPLHPRKQTAERCRAIFAIRRPARLEVVDPNLLG